MAVDYRKPGVYVEESLLLGGADIGNANTTAFFTGVTPSGPTNQPVFCNNWSDYVRIFGGFTKALDPDTPTNVVTSYLPYSVYMYFLNGGRPCWVQRAVASGSAGDFATLDVAGDAGAWSLYNGRKLMVSGAAYLYNTAVHSWSSGAVDVASTGTTSMNGPFTPTAPSTKTLSYAVTGSPADVLGDSITVTNYSLTTNVVTVTTAARSPETIAVGQPVHLALTSGTSHAVLDGVHIVTGVPTNTSFTFALTNADIPAVGAGSYGPAYLGSTITNANSKVISGETTAFTITAKSPGALTGRDGIAVTLSEITPGAGFYTLTVYKGDGTDAAPHEHYETFTNLALTDEVLGTKVFDQAINDPYNGSTLITIDSFNSANTPQYITTIADGQLAGGTNPSLPTALDLVGAAVDGNTENGGGGASIISGPLLLNIAGYNTRASGGDPVYVTASVGSSSFPDRGDIFIINDSSEPRGSTDSSESYMNTLLGGGSDLTAFTGVSYVASYAPWLVIANPQGSGTVTIPPGGAAAGVFGRVDSTVGVYRAPAGIIAGVSGAVGVDTKFTDAQLGQLNSYNVNVIRPVTGAGMAIMGARTRKQYGADRYVSARRTLIYLKETLRRSTEYALFENNDQRLWASLTATADRILRPLWAEGGLRGNSAAEAYYIVCDATVNTPQVISSGEVRMEIGVALEYPAEFIIIRVSQFERASTFNEIQPNG